MPSLLIFPQSFLEQPGGSLSIDEITEKPQVLTLFVPGKPEPQGSAKGFPIKRKSGKVGVTITSDNPKLKGFRAIVQQHVKEAAVNMAGGAFTETPIFTGVPLRVQARFVMPRPSSAPKTAKGKALGYHCTKPDLDKLQRAVGDALSGCGGGYAVIAEDSQIACWNAEKRYAAIGEEAGTWLEVRAL